MARRETLNEAYLEEAVTRSGGETRKVVFPGRRGAPDRLCGWIDGRAAWVEVKEEDQPWGLQDHQARQHAWLKACGMRVYTLYNREQIDKFVAEMIGPAVRRVR